MPPGKAGEPAAHRTAVQYFVRGVSDHDVAEKVAGVYAQAGAHLGRPVFARQNPARGATTLLYHCAIRGWCFGPAVGDKEVWASNPDAGGSLPPRQGWLVGNSSGGNPDSTLRVEGLWQGRTLGGARDAIPPGAPSARPGPRDADQLRKWLLSLSHGDEALLQYHQALVDEFDGDLKQIAAARMEGVTSAGSCAHVDPEFWETIRCTKAGHKLLLAKGICDLP